MSLQAAFDQCLRAIRERNDARFHHPERDQVRSYSAPVFFGTVTINASAEQANREARQRWTDYMSDAGDHMVMSVYCDASCLADDARVGYALVFRRCRPGAPDNGDVVEMSWGLEGIAGYGEMASVPLFSETVEALACLQALKVATKEVDNWLKECVHKPKSVTLYSFHDNQLVLKNLQPGGGDRVVLTKSALVSREVRNEIARESNRFRDMVLSHGVEPNLNLRWLKAHTNTVWPHDEADWLAGETARDSAANPDLDYAFGCVQWQRTDGSWDWDYIEVDSSVYSGELKTRIETLLEQNASLPKTISESNR